MDNDSQYLYLCMYRECSLCLVFKYKYWEKF